MHATEFQTLDEAVPVFETLCVVEFGQAVKFRARNGRVV